MDEGKELTVRLSMNLYKNKTKGLIKNQLIELLDDNETDFSHLDAKDLSYLAAISLLRINFLTGDVELTDIISQLEDIYEKNKEDQ